MCRRRRRPIWIGGRNSVKRIDQYEARTLTATASTQTQLQIGFLDYWLTGIDITFFMSYSNSAAAAYQDPLPRSISSLVVQDGGRSYVSTTGALDLRGLYWMVRQRHQGRFRAPDYNASATAPVLPWNLPLVFSPEPNLYDEQVNWWDPRVGIQPSAGLTLAINWAANSVSGSGSTLQTGGKTYALLHYYGIIPEAGDPVPQFYPNWQFTQFTPTATSQGLQQVLPINPGPYYRRVHQMITKGAQNGSGGDIREDGWHASAGSLATNSCISEVGVVTSDKRLPIYQKTYAACRSSQTQFPGGDDNTYAVAYAAATAAYGASVLSVPYNVGVYHYDLAKFLKLGSTDDPVFGANSAGKTPTSLQLGYTVDNISNAFVTVGFEAYGKY